MEQETGYNGWKNYETWAMALWIDNDQGSYTYSRELVAETLEGADWPSVADSGTIQVADALKEWQESEMPDLEASVWTDLLRAAFGEVDWYEIAQNYMSELSLAGDEG